jgi:hypothetical protein
MASIVPLLIVAGVALAAGGPVLCAQDAAPYTLHVYADHIQVPALVLDEDLKPAASVTREQFAIRLDHGRAFQPTQMRVEGDDPISLAVLLDASGDQDGILKAFGQAISGLVPQPLHPADRVSIYALDCTLKESADQVPADAAALEAGVAAALASPGLHGAQQHGACGSSIHLWDAIAKVVGTLGERPGRRVLLVVSKGMDGKSTHGFAETVHAAESKSVAIFGLRYLEYPDNTPIKFSGNTLTVHYGPVAVNTLTLPNGGDPNFFDQMCQSTGGLAFNLWNPASLNRVAPDVAPSLDNMVALLRSRYILEFPRPDAYAPGQHYVAVTVPRTRNLVLTTGVSYISSDPAHLAGPTTVRSDPSPAEFGPRHPLETKQ